jgi:hypothetical protein
MRERPILFSGPMVRAILAGTKTQTRRVVKPQPEAQHGGEPYWFIGGYRAWQYRSTDDVLRKGGNTLRCPYGAPGDRLWVREAWQALDGNERARRIMTEPNPSRGWLEYAATVPEGYEPPPRWRPSIHMPRWASRITLEVTGVRVERLQDISSNDAIAEGIEPCPRGGEWRNYLDSAPNRDALTPRVSFRSLWESINGPGSWEANPYVWAVSFREVSP